MALGKLFCLKLDQRVKQYNSSPESGRHKGTKECKINSHFLYIPLASSLLLCSPLFIYDVLFIRHTPSFLPLTLTQVLTPPNSPGTEPRLSTALWIVRMGQMQSINSSTGTHKEQLYDLKDRLPSLRQYSHAHMCLETLSGCLYWLWQGQNPKYSFLCGIHLTV